MANEPALAVRLRFANPLGGQANGVPVCYAEVNSDCFFAWGPLHDQSCNLEPQGTAIANKWTSSGLLDTCRYLRVPFQTSGTAFSRSPL